MNNPFQLLQAIRNPQAFLQNVMNDSQVMNNPMMRNGIEMYQKGDTKGVENLVRNICQQRGIDLEELRKQMGI